MKKSVALTALMLSLSLLTPSILPIQAQPMEAVKEPIVKITNASNSAFSGYNITADTKDGGWITFLFIWQRKISWDYPGFSGEVIFDTPPILQMSKYFENGTLDYSITYIPLFLIQYNDTNDNSLFDLWTTNRRSFSAEINDDMIDWWTQLDKPYKAYPLAPIFHFSRSHAWSWEVSPLINESINVDGIETPTYSWNISATVPSVSWLREYKPGWRRQLPEATTLDVFFGYNLTLRRDNPEVKYDFQFSNITWANDDNSTKLAMMSAVLYHSRKPPVVRVGVKRCFDFSETVPISVAIKKFTIADNVTDNINAFVNYSPDAIIDGVLTENVVNASLNPLFLIPAPMMAPEGVYIRGTYPGIEGRRTWRHYLAFSHQLGLPHFENYVAQDPVISVAATLSTTVISFLPGDLLPLRVIATVAVFATAAFTIYYLGKRRITAPIKTAQPP